MRRNRKQTSPKFHMSRQQRTLRHVIGCAGVGLHSGARVGLTLCPAAESTGIRFRRVDRHGTEPIAASLAQVSGAGMGTCLGHPTGGVHMIQHLMAAFAACEIDNALVEISGPELPIMDGSARPFVLLMECAGTLEQSHPAATLELLQPVAASSDRGTARLEPAGGLELFVDAPKGRRPFAFRFSSEGCKSELVAARTEACRDRVGNDRTDRFADEPTRHATLDALADIALIPARLKGRLIQSGDDPHLRRDLLRRLLADRRSWRLIDGANPTPAWISSAPTAYAC